MPKELNTFAVYCRVRNLLRRYTSNKKMACGVLHYNYEKLMSKKITLEY